MIESGEAMQIHVRLEDGGEQTLDVSELALMVDGWRLEVPPEKDPLKFSFHAPVQADVFCSFVVHHRCANTMTLEVRPYPREEPPP